MLQFSQLNPALIESQTSQRFKEQLPYRMKKIKLLRSLYTSQLTPLLDNLKRL
jgi:hypothetical protein